MYSQRGTSVTTVSFYNIFISSERYLVTISHHSPPYSLLFVSIDLLILDISYKWNHKYVGFLWLFKGKKASLVYLNFLRI